MSRTNNPDVARDVAFTILYAIEKGVDAFNKGSSDRCLSLYKDALDKSIQKLSQYTDIDYFSTISQNFETCKKKLGSISEEEDEKACWEIRKDFDAAIELMKEKSGLKFKPNVVEKPSDTTIDTQRVSQRTSQKLHGSNIDELGLKEIRIRMEEGKNPIKLKKHSGGILKSFKESFTGTEALLWCKTEIKLQEKQAIDLMIKLIEKRFIVSCADPKHLKFKDKEVYKFLPVKITESEQKQLEKEEKLLTSGQEVAKYILDEPAPTPTPTPKNTPKSEKIDPMIDGPKISPKENSKNTPKSPHRDSNNKTNNNNSMSNKKIDIKIYGPRLEPLPEPEKFDSKTSSSLLIIALNVCNWFPFITTDSQKRKGGWILDLRLVCKDFNAAICSRTFLNLWLPSDQQELKNKIESAFHSITLSPSELLCLLIKENGRLEKSQKEPAKKKAFTRNNNSDKDESYEQATWIIGQQNSLFQLRRFGKGAIPVPKQRREPKFAEREIFTTKNTK